MILIIQIFCFALAVIAVLLFRSDIIAFKAFGLIFAIPLVIWLLSALFAIGHKVFKLFKGQSLVSADFVTLLTSALIIITVFVFMQSAKRYPIIHDISTDLISPPEFDQIVSLRKADDNSLEYDSAITELQREAYPNIKPIETSLSTEEAFARILLLAKQFNWNIEFTNTEKGLIEATSRSAVFKFVDDIVVRVSESEVGSTIDLRSVSRVGKGDFGANAKRIQAFINAF